MVWVRDVMDTAAGPPTGTHFHAASAPPDRRGSVSSTATVLYVVDALGLGGKTKSMVDLACNLDPARYRAVVCTFTEEGGILPERLRLHGIPLHTVPCADGLNFGMVARIAPLIWKVRPAVVHCYNPRPIVYGGIAARLMGVRGTVGSLSAFACQVPDRTYDFLP